MQDLFTVGANLAGIPGISVPIYRTGGLPTSLQLLAPAFQEELLLQVAYATEKVQ